MQDILKQFIKSKNTMFVLILIMGLVYFFWGLNNGQEQDEVFQNDYKVMTLVRQMVTENKYTNAEPIIKQLQQKYPDSYIVTWQYAVVLAGNGQIQEAKKYYLLTQQQRPFIVKNQNFLTQIGQIYYIEGDYNNAKKYFQVSKGINTNQELTTLADTALAEIAKKGY